MNKDQVEIQGNEMTPFGKKLLARLRKANERLEGVEKIDDLQSQLTVRRVKLHLEPRAISGAEIKEIRQSFNASQGVFAMFIQVPVRTLQEWEQGRSTISGSAARLIDEMIRDPEYWRARLHESFEMAK